MAPTWSQGHDRSKPACGKGKHEALQHQKTVITNYDEWLNRRIPALAFPLSHGVVGDG